MSTDVICGDKAASCHCSLLPGHDGPHECHRQGCSGSWEYVDNEFRVVRFPMGGTTPAPTTLIFASMLGLLGGDES